MNAESLAPIVRGIHSAAKRLSREARREMRSFCTDGGRRAPQKHARPVWPTLQEVDGSQRAGVRTWRHVAAATESARAYLPESRAVPPESTG
jgi:hypothetical protein